MFTEIFDGLRSYYARYPSRKAACGFHAAMTMSFLFSATLASAAVLADYLINGSIGRTASLFENKALLILIGAVIAYLHVHLAKRTGRYHSAEPFPAPHWKSYIWIYACLSTSLVLGAVLVAWQSTREVPDAYAKTGHSEASAKMPESRH